MIIALLKKFVPRGQAFCLLCIMLRRILFMLKNNKKPMLLVCINNVETVDVFVAIITLKSDVYV